MLPPIVSKFIAGENKEQAIDYATSELRPDSICPMFNRLGEHYSSKEEAKADFNEYIELIELCSQEYEGSSISVKPSQIGLDVDEDLFSKLLYDLVEHGHEHDVEVWVDMEDESTVEPTLEAVIEATQDFGSAVGVCLQANLRRTPYDIDRLQEYELKIRLVKGAYNEPEEIAYQSKERVNQAYKELLERLLANHSGTVAIGTHDPEMISHMKELAEVYDCSPEIQMLMGVREDAQRALAKEWTVRQYAPYGPEWLSYFYRRVRERWQNAWFALRAVTGV